jgi:PKD repeat protein
LAIAILGALCACGGGGGGGGGAIGAAPKTGAAPTPDFTRSLTNPFVGQSVTFTDLSTGNPTSWSWDFNDDGTEDSNVQNPSHMYAAPGTYSIKLTASNQFGSKSVTKPSAITVHVALAVKFATNATCSSWTPRRARRHRGNGTSTAT